MNDVILLVDERRGAVIPAGLVVNGTEIGHVARAQLPFEPQEICIVTVDLLANRVRTMTRAQWERLKIAIALDIARSRT